MFCFCFRFALIKTSDVGGGLKKRSLFVVTSSATKGIMKKDSIREVKSTDKYLQTGKTYMLNKVTMITRKFVAHT